MLLVEHKSILVFTSDTRIYAVKTVSREIISFPLPIKSQALDQGLQYLIDPNSLEKTSEALKMLLFDPWNIKQVGVTFEKIEFVMGKLYGFRKEETLMHLQYF